MYTTVSRKNDSDAKRILLTVTYWKDGVLHKVPATKETVETFLSHYNNGKGYFFFVNSDLNLYACTDNHAINAEMITTVNHLIEATFTYREIESIGMDHDGLTKFISTNGFAFHSDGGHGWLKVPLSLIKYLGINELISGFSYQDSTHAYLEEDCDLTTFLIATGLYRPNPNVFQKQFCQAFMRMVPEVYAHHSPIRNYPHYDVAKNAKRFNSSSLAPLSGRAAKMA